MSYNENAVNREIMLFTLHESRFAIYLSAVERVVQAVEITPLPKAPEIVLGIINVHGQIVPVMDIRQRFNLPRRDVGLDDQFILVHTARRLIALFVDTVNDIQVLAEQEILTGDQIPFGSGSIAGVIKLENDLILICELDQFLSLDEERKLEKVMPEASGTLSMIGD